MEICYCLRNDIKSKPFLESFIGFTGNNSCNVRINLHHKKVETAIQTKEQKATSIVLFMEIYLHAKTRTSVKRNGMLKLDGVSIKI